MCFCWHSLCRLALARWPDVNFDLMIQIMQQAITNERQAVATVKQSKGKKPQTRKKTISPSITTGPPCGATTSRIRIGLPTVSHMSWRRLPTGETIPAMPHLDEILTEGHLESLITSFVELSTWFLPTSSAFTRDVRRVPLKFDHGVSEEEEAHLRASSDGLKYFIPLEIHSA